MIGDFAFFGCENLEIVSIPSSVISIGSNSFDGCKNLKEITIPPSVTTIGKYAFSECQKIEELIVPSSVTSIGNYFNCICYSLKKVIIPKDIQKIGYLNFQKSLITEFSIPSSMTTIISAAFNKCKSLVKVEIPSSVTSIEKLAFCGCSSLKEITIPQSVTEINDSTFMKCSSLSKVNILSSLVSIGFNAFSECKSLVNITLPSTVTSIAFNAFNECESLEKIIVLKRTIESPKIEIKSNTQEIKIISLGASGVGKTSIIDRYVYDVYRNDSPPTMLIDFKTKNMAIDGNNIYFKIWDASGMEKYHLAVKNYYVVVEVAIAVFDLSDPETLNIADLYLNEIKDEVSPLLFILLGNKCELDHKVRYEDIKKLESKYNAKYFEVSAENSINIDNTFNYIVNETKTKTFNEINKVKRLIDYNDTIVNNEGGNVVINDEIEKRKKKHCNVF